MVNSRAERGKFAVIVIFRVLESKVDEFQQALRVHSENAWGEAGSRKFVSYVDEVDPTTFYLYELYENREAFEAHTRAEYMPLFRERANPLLREPAVVLRGFPVFKEYSSPKGDI